MRFTHPSVIKWFESLNYNCREKDNSRLSLTAKKYILCADVSRQKEQIYWDIVANEIRPLLHDEEAYDEYFTSYIKPFVTYVCFSKTELLIYDSDTSRLSTEQKKIKNSLKTRLTRIKQKILFSLFTELKDDKKIVEQKKKIDSAVKELLKMTPLEMRRKYGLQRAENVSTPVIAEEKPLPPYGPLFRMTPITPATPATPATPVTPVVLIGEAKTDGDEDNDGDDNDK